MARAPLAHRRWRRLLVARTRAARSRHGPRVVRARSPLPRQGRPPAVRRPQLFDVAIDDLAAQRDVRRLTHNRHGQRYPRSLAKALREAAGQPRGPPRRATAVDGRVFARRSPAGREERGRGDAVRGEEDWGFYSKAAFVGNELASERRAAGGEGGGSGLHTRAEHGARAQQLPAPIDPEVDAERDLRRLTHNGQGGRYPTSLAKALKEVAAQPRAPPGRATAVDGRVFAGRSPAGGEERGCGGADRGEEDGDFTQAAFLSHEVASQRRSGLHTPDEHGGPAQEAGNLSSFDGHPELPLHTGGGPSELADEIDEINRIKNAQAAAEFMRELGQELNLLPAPPRATSTPAASPSLPPASLHSASGTLRLTVSTRDDAIDAVTAAASSTVGITIRVSEDIPLGAVTEICSILYDGSFQSFVLEDPEILAKKVSQATELMTEIRNAEDNLGRLQMLLHHPWLP